MRQEVTRMHKGWALDNVTLHNEVTKFTPDEIRTPPSVRHLRYPFDFQKDRTHHKFSLCTGGSIRVRALFGRRWMG